MYGVTIENPVRKTLLALIAVGPLSTLGSGQIAPTTAPKLMLVIAVDQMRSDFLERFAPLYRSSRKTTLRRRSHTC